MTSKSRGDICGVVTLGDEFNDSLVFRERLDGLELLLPGAGCEGGEMLLEVECLRLLVHYFELLNSNYKSSPFYSFQ